MVTTVTVTKIIEQKTPQGHNLGASLWFDGTKTVLSLLSQQ